MAKRLFLVHGRSTKPRKAVKEKAVLEALVHGLNRVDPTAAKKINSTVKTTFVYYGDLSNKVMVESDPDLKKVLKHDPKDGVYYEPDDCYTAPLAMLFSRPNDRFTKEEYKQLNAKFEDERFKDDLARLASPILANGLSRRIIRNWLPDLGRYIAKGEFGSQVRERLQPALKAALAAGDDIAVVSHSMGCVVSYDVLWKLSRMSEHKDVHGRKIRHWITLGSPLGEPSIAEQLYDSNEGDRRYPANITAWTNIAAKDDFVAHDMTNADDFKELARRTKTKIKDLPKIYTFWVNQGKVNPHKFFGYLDHPVVAKTIAEWVRY